MSEDDDREYIPSRSQHKKKKSRRTKNKKSSRSMHQRKNNAQKENLGIVKAKEKLCTEFFKYHTCITDLQQKDCHDQHTMPMRQITNTEKRTRSTRNNKVSLIDNDHQENIVSNFVEIGSLDYLEEPTNFENYYEPDKQENTDLWYTDDYFLLKEPFPEYDPEYIKPNPHLDNMCKIYEAMGVEVSESLKSLTEQRKISDACAIFKHVTPSLELRTMKFEMDEKTIFLKEESKNIMLLQAFRQAEIGLVRHPMRLRFTVRRR